jgi:2',3'-cyclic-nucleotide 2'-phosphodiesterase / 3'-nucleotidase
MSSVGQTPRSAAGLQARQAFFRKPGSLPHILLLSLAFLARAESVTVTVLATTDLHGNLYPIDYVTDRPAPRGLAKIATLIRAAESENPNHLLIDCGDTIQGTPLESVYQAAIQKGAMLAGDPMMLAMNRLAYDAMTVGNHEYNFGLPNLNAARALAQFPWLSANTTVAPGTRERPYAPYFVRTVAGVKVAVIGITTPAVPTWEKPENLGGYRFGAAVDAVRKALAELRQREHPDLVLLAAHAGLGRNLETGAPEDPAENVVYEIAAAVPELDAIVFGHSHRELEGRSIGKVLVVQPRNWGMSLARLDFTFERAAGAWKLADKRSLLLPVKPETAAAADILEIARPYHEAAERYLNTPVATSARPLDAALGRVEDTAVVDAVQQVQLFYSHADVSFTALFNPSVRIPMGQVTARQIAALYPYDNELYVIEGTGKMVRDALENAARYYRSCAGDGCGKGPLVNREVMGFNYDMAGGVEYIIDVERPEGDRIHDLRWHGQPLAPEQKLRIAINNYRAAGSAGYSMFRGAKVVWRSGDEIRELMIRYYAEHKSLPSEASGNWRVLPELARRTLEREAAQDAARQQLQ